MKSFLSVMFVKQLRSPPLTQLALALTMCMARAFGDTVISF